VSRFPQKVMDTFSTVWNFKLYDFNFDLAIFQ
jgi:hypothetical protein